MMNEISAIQNMENIFCCCVIFALDAKITQQQFFSLYANGISKFRNADEICNLTLLRREG